MIEIEDDAERFDVLIVPGRPGFRLAEQGVAALARFLGVSQLLVLRERVTGEGWAELYFDPDLFAHYLFVESEATALPPLEEAVLRYGTTPCLAPYGESAGQPVYMYLELVGALYPDVTQDIRDRLQQMLYLRPQVSSRPHAPLPHAPPAPDGVARERHRAGRATVSVEDR